MRVIFPPARSRRSGRGPRGSIERAAERNHGEWCNRAPRGGGCLRSGRADAGTGRGGFWLLTGGRLRSDFPLLGRAGWRVDTRQRGGGQRNCAGGRLQRPDRELSDPGRLAGRANADRSQPARDNVDGHALGRRRRRRIDPVSGARELDLGSRPAEYGPARDRVPAGAGRCIGQRRGAVDLCRRGGVGAVWGGGGVVCRLGGGGGAGGPEGGPGGGGGGGTRGGGPRFVRGGG